MQKTKIRRKASRSLTCILATNIRTFRSDKSVSQEEFANTCSLHRTYVGSVERGERNVSLSTLEMFASAMNISVSRLLTKQAFKK